MRILRILIIGLFLLSSSCVTFNVVSHVNESIDFSKYHTFKMVNEIEKPGSKDEYAALDDLDRAIAKEMTDRDYVEGPGADLGVHYRIIIDRQVDYHLDPFTNPYSSSGYGYATAKRYSEGILIVEMRDRINRKVVWQASLDLRINKKKKKGNIIYDTVHLIFEKYPFVAGKNSPVIPKEK